MRIPMSTMELSGVFIFWSPAFSITADDFYTVSGGILLSLQEGSDESATIVINPPFALYGNIIVILL